MKGTREDRPAGRTTHQALTLESELWAQPRPEVHVSSPIHSFISQMDSEGLLYSRHCSGHSGQATRALALGRVRLRT